RYTHRLFTEHELESCGEDPATSASGLAGRFAAKEAVLKVLDLGEVVPSWKAIEVHRGTTGRPQIILSGDAAAIAHRQGVRDMSVSLSHAGGIATAAVVARVSPRRFGGRR
ncbi:MAG: 4'-phosphopantetheinyl transferase superfamily protein, partial [Acidimicrobiales bacterium]